MQKRPLVWHRLAQPLAFAWLLGCSGEADDVAPDDPVHEQADDQEHDTDSRDRVAEPVFEAMPTSIRVINRSDHVLSRYKAAAVETMLDIRPQSVSEIAPMPTCSRVDCASLGPGEVVTPQSVCSAVTIAPLRHDLSPGDSDEYMSWDGVFWSLTERNCYEPQSFEPGTPMLAHVCFGEPGPGPADVTALSCEDLLFAYGQPLVETEFE